MSIPPSLQAGTPISARGGDPFSDYGLRFSAYSSPPRVRRDSDWDHRESTVSIGSVRTTRNYSYGNGDTYFPERVLSPLPATPPAPSFSPHTSYSHVQDPFDALGAVPKRRARKQSLLSKIGSIRSSRQQRYGSVGSEDPESMFSRGTRHQRLASVDEEMDGPGYGIDLSTLASPIESRRPNLRPVQRSRYASAGSRDIAPDELAAVFGSGLENISMRVLETSRDKSLTDVRVRENAQTIADKSGEILAVQERHASVSSDITALSGGFDAQRMSMMPVAGDKISYFLPEDSNPPNWRPFCMHWTYIAVLVVIALSLAVVQEYLCQISMAGKKDNKGILNFKQPQDISVIDYFA